MSYCLDGAGRADHYRRIRGPRRRAKEAAEEPRRRAALPLPRVIERRAPLHALVCRASLFYHAPPMGRNGGRARAVLSAY